MISRSSSSSMVWTPLKMGGRSLPGLFITVMIFKLVITPVQGLSNALESATSGRPKKFYGGAGVGRLILDEKFDEWKCAYDMVLVERVQGKPKTESGLFIPQEDLPRLHLCRVISFGPGREEENGIIAPMPSIKVGDLIVAKNPWGIGPKDEETGDGRKLSFMRAQDIAAVLDGEILGEFN